MAKRISLSLAKESGKEMEYIQKAFDDNWLTTEGPNINQFENILADYLEDDSYVVALNSGTSAIHLGLILLGIEKEDEVIAQDLTFIASVNPVKYIGGIPIFVDSEEDTWNISPEYLEKAIQNRIKKGKKPKAIIVVHLFGMPAKMNEIQEISFKYDIPILEDAAEALGSMYEGKHCGTLGKVGVISFNGNKIITTTGGGVLISKSKSLIEKSRFLAAQSKDPAPHYEHSQIGYNYRMSNVSAGIGIAQMEVLQERVEGRRMINHLYRELLENIPGISFQNETDSRFFSNYWLSCILIDSSKTQGITNHIIAKELKNQQIETRPIWKPMHLQPIFKDAPFYGDKVSENLFNSGLCLPSSNSLSKDDILLICQTIKNIFQ